MLWKVLIFSWYLFASDCPKTCSDWKQLSLYQKGDTCYKDEMRSCNITLLESFNNQEYRQSTFGKLLKSILNGFYSTCKIFTMFNLWFKRQQFWSDFFLTHYFQLATFKIVQSFQSQIVMSWPSYSKTYPGLLWSSVFYFPPIFLDCTDNCTNWSAPSTFERSGSCFLLTKKTCLNEVLKVSRTEYNETKVDCPLKTTIGPIVTPTGNFFSILWIFLTLEFQSFGIEWNYVHPAALLS